MTSVMVFVKRNGIVMACQPFQQPDGCVWVCAHCRSVVIRASFGVMNGMLRCSCGCDVELCVDGKFVEVSELNVLAGFPQQVNEPVTEEKPRRKRRKKISDKDFLRECGIATEETP